MFLVTTPDPWRIEPTDGTVIAVWAAAFSKDGDQTVFDVIVDADEQERSLLDVTGEFASKPDRVVMVVARFPTAAVKSIETAWPFEISAGHDPDQGPVQAILVRAPQPEGR